MVTDRPRLQLEERAGAAGLAVREGVLLDLVDDGAAGLAPGDGQVARPVARDLEGEAVPDGLAELRDLACAGLAVGLDLDLRALAGRDAVGLRLHLRRARAVGVADIALRRFHRVGRTIERVALLDRDAADRVAVGSVATPTRTARSSDASRVEISHFPSICAGSRDRRRNPRRRSARAALRFAPRRSRPPSWRRRTHDHSDPKSHVSFPRQLDLPLDDHAVLERDDAVEAAGEIEIVGGDERGEAGVARRGR